MAVSAGQFGASVFPDLPTNVLQFERRVLLGARYSL
jgi:hypothetical protein